MRIELPTPEQNSMVEQAFYSITRKGLVVGARKGLFSTHTIRQALQRISSGGLVILPEGEWDGFTLDKKAEITADDDSAPIITSTIEISQRGFLYLKGITVRPAAGSSAIRLQGGTLICEDCEILGPVESESGHLYFSNCLIISDETTLICSGGSLEASACRIRGKVAGILAQADCAVNLFHNRIEKCHTDGGGDGAPGAGFFGEKIRLVASGTEFFANGVGTYLKDCPSITLANNLFHHNSHAAIVSISESNGKLVISNCRMDGPQSQDCARISLQGGSASIHHTDSAAATAVALSSVGVDLDVIESRFSSSELPAVEIEGGQVSWQGGEISSLAARGLAAWDTKGKMTDVTIIGALPVPEDPANLLSFINCSFRESGSQTPNKPESDKPLLIQMIASLEDIIGQKEAKEEMKSLLRRAIVEKENTERALRQTTGFHGLVSGPVGCGKLKTLTLLGQALTKIGTLRSPEIRQITLADLKSAHVLEGEDWGFLFIRARTDVGVTLRSPGVAESLLHLCQSMPQGTSLLIEGDRDALAIFLKFNPSLDKLISFEFHFLPYTPPEMAALFAKRSLQDKVTLDHEAARKLPLLLHFLQERMQKKFGDLQSIENLYLSALRKEASAPSSPVSGFVITPEHLETPVDKLIAKPASRSPAFAVICPACHTENPWVPGLPEQTRCLHCEAPLGDQWGIWKDSSYFRKRQDTSHLARTGAVARRRIIRAGAET